MPTHKPSLAEVSISQLVELTGKAHRTVAKRLDAACVKPIRQDGKTLFYAPQAALPAIYREGAGAKDPFAEKARLDAARADLAELDLERKRGDVLDRADVVATWSTHIAATRTRLRAIPKRLAVSVPGFTRQMAHAALDLIDEALNELAGDSGAERRTRVRRSAKNVAASAPDPG